MYFNSYVPAGWFMINNTFTTSASIKLTYSTDTRYRCKAFGTALGERNGSYVTVTINKRSHDVTGKLIATSQWELRIYID